MAFQYRTKGTCSSSVSFEIQDGCLHNVYFEGGCNGNTKGISLLAEGQDARMVADRLCGVRCGFKDTSCPDQLSKAIKQALLSMDEKGN